jgi:hypothetical protein
MTSVDQQLENALFAIITCCKMHSYNMTVDYETPLKKFVATLQKASDTQLFYFKSRFLSDLQDAKPIIAKLSRSWHDKIYNKLQLSNGSAITHMFHEFIKGVTYFKQEEDPKAMPIYHRLYACGPYADTHRQGNLICHANLSKEELRRRRPLIERCYIERMIYDDIYKKFALHFPKGHESPTQDEGHVARMKLTKEDFETCFPDTDIQVQVDAEDNMPMKLTITRTVRGGKVTTLIYERALENFTFFGIRPYRENVVCTRTDPDGSMSVKITNFYNQGKWERQKA